MGRFIAIEIWMFPVSVGSLLSENMSLQARKVEIIIFILLL
jgi:hypothetical protein